MKKRAGKLLCLILCGVLILSALTGIRSVLVQAKASENLGFKTVNNFCAVSQATAVAQGYEAWRIAASQTTNAIADKMYDILFTATYRVNDFGGSLWPKDNTGSSIRSMYDPGLGVTVNWNWGAWGCFSYSMFVSQYVRGSNGVNNSRVVKSVPSGEQLKQFLQSYADPGEHIAYYYGRSGQHSVTFLASDADGFYLISDNGNSKDIRLYYTTYSYFAATLRSTGSECFRLYDTNWGKDTPSDTYPTTAATQSAQTTEASAEVTESEEASTEPAATGPVLLSSMDYNGHTYELYTGNGSWTDAALYAQKRGGYLATVTSSAEESVLCALLQAATTPFCWIGVRDLKADFAYTWMSGESMIYSNFADDAALNTNCYGFMYTPYCGDLSLSGKWNTAEETFVYKGTPYDTDTFNFAVEIGTAFPDPVEEVTTFIWNGHCYIVYDGELSYEQAALFCKSQGGHLVTVDETDELFALMGTKYTSGAKYWMESLYTSQQDGGLLITGSASSQHYVLQASGSIGNTVQSIGNATECGFICEIEATEYAVGDVTMDGNVGSDDARLVLRLAVRLDSAEDSVYALADVNGDGTVDAMDARCILRAAVGLEDRLNWGSVAVDAAGNIVY